MRGEDMVLLVQDTTSFDFSHHPAAGGMGPLENRHCRGFLAHSTLAVSAVGVPLGVLEQQVWTRLDSETGQRHQRKERPFIDKESYKWVDGLPPLPEPGLSARSVTVCDREGHIFEFFEAVLERGLAFIVRASKGRGFTPEADELFTAIAAYPVQHRATLALKRRPDREPREAQVELRYTSLTLKRPNHAPVERQELRVQAVEVREAQPPAGEEAVHWLLLTTLPVETLVQAQQIVTWYTYRWLIERFHYVLKSGCKLEDKQLREEKRLERLLAVYSLVAWKLLWLTYLARQTPNHPCTEVLQGIEWQALYAFVHRTTRLPTAVPTLHQATRWIAQLGGFLGRKGDGEPGVKVLWRGWTRLQDITQTWSIVHPPAPKDVGNA